MMDVAISLFLFIEEIRNPLGSTALMLFLTIGGIIGIVVVVVVVVVIVVVRVWE